MTGHVMKIGEIIEKQMYVFYIRGGWIDCVQGLSFHFVQVYLAFQVTDCTKRFYMYILTKIEILEQNKEKEASSPYRISFSVR